MYSELAAAADAVFHVGAVVNWLMRYSEMRAANVAATIALLSFAAHSRIKLFVEISTLRHELGDFSTSLI